MRSRSFSGPLSPFGQYLVQLCEKRNVPVFSMTDIVGSKTRLSFALRGRGTSKHRGALLQYDELERIGDRLEANREEIRRLILLGLLEHAPPELRSCVVGLASDVSRFAHRLNARTPNFDFSGDTRELPDPL